MDILYSQTLENRPAELDLLRRVSAQLPELIGPQSAPLVKAEWDVAPDPPGGQVYRLSLKDFTGQVSSDITPAELNNPLHMRFRLNHLWGDLLQIHSDRARENTERAMAALVEGEE